MSQLTTLLLAAIIWTRSSSLVSDWMMESRRGTETSSNNNRRLYKVWINLWVNIYIRTQTQTAVLMSKKWNWIALESHPHNRTCCTIYLVLLVISRFELLNSQSCLLFLPFLIDCWTLNWAEKISIHLGQFLAFSSLSFVTLTLSSYGSPKPCSGAKGVPLSYVSIT